MAKGPDGGSRQWDQLLDIPDTTLLRIVAPQVGSKWRLQGEVATLISEEPSVGGIAHLANLGTHDTMSLHILFIPISTTTRFRSVLLHGRRVHARVRPSS